MKIAPFPGKLTAQMVVCPFITKTGKTRHQRIRMYILTPEQEAWFRRWFPEVENIILMKATGMSQTTLHRFARKFGLTKSERGFRGIMKRQAILCKKINEANGYYDSLRGKPVSEACRKAVSRMWQEIRDGKREHPFAVMKRDNPRKYRQYMQHKSEERKETIRKETRRVLYGLKRKTRLKCVVMCPYTKRQTSHRYNALLRGYIVMQDCSDQGGERYNIYYDDQTHRAPIFERNLLADGFQVKRWTATQKATKDI